MLADLAALEPLELSSLKPLQQVSAQRLYTCSVNELKQSSLESHLAKARISGRASLLTDVQLNNISEHLSSQIFTIETGLEYLRQYENELISALSRVRNVHRTVQELQKQPIADTSSLPDDILWQIMEISVLEDGAPQGKLLSLVSQHVQAWVDPLLFKKVKDIAKLSIITSSPRLTRAARRASCLYGASFASSKSLNSLAHHFPALHTLILESEVNWRIWDDEVTFIRRLECYPGQATVAFSRAIFPNITHLSLVYPAIDKIYWPWLSQIPALHFLALMTSQRWWQDDEHRQIFKLTEVVRNMSRVTKRHIESDSLKVILWHQSNFHSISLDEFEKGAQEIVDDRLIVGIPTRTRSGPVTWYDRRTHIWPFLQVPLDRWGHTRCLLDLAPEAGELLRSREVFGLFQHA